MNLAEEFKKLKEGQEQILLNITQAGNSDKITQMVYTLDEVAKLFSVTKRTIYNWKDEGRLPLTIIGSKSYMTNSQLQSFLAVNEVKPFKVGRF